MSKISGMQLILFTEIISVIHYDKFSTVFCQFKDNNKKTGKSWEICSALELKTGRLHV